MGGVSLTEQECDAIQRIAVRRFVESLIPERPRTITVITDRGEVRLDELFRGEDFYIRIGVRAVEHAPLPRAEQALKKIRGDLYRFSASIEKPLPVILVAVPINESGNAIGQPTSFNLSARTGGTG